jgi:hypothetical protein
LIHEWVVDHADDRDSFVGETDRGTDHGKSVDLDHQYRIPVLTSALTKLVVPSIGLAMSAPPSVRGHISLLNYALSCTDFFLMEYGAYRSKWEHR